MKKILMLGAGMVAKPMAEYLLKNDFQLTIASRTVSKAERLIGMNKSGAAVSWTVDDVKKLEDLVSKHDLTISLLPFDYHLTVAKFCIKHKKNMITTSYVSEEMKKLNDDAIEAGIIILNEVGVDPGLDHMSAMQIIDNVHESGGKIKKFYSMCGALPAPEEADNPLRYKFSWSPTGVLKAGNSGAKYLQNGNITEVPTENLFKNPLKMDFTGVGKMEIYPNRDSLQYINLYNLPETETMYRGTFRFPNWCETMDAIKELGMIDYKVRDFNNKSYKQVVAEQLGVYPRNVKEKVAERLQLDLQSPAIIAMEWLGFFDKDMVKPKISSNFDLTAHLMQNRMMLPKGAKDMVVILHSFLVENKSGKNEVITSRLLEYGTTENTAIARTVALPAAIAAKLIISGKINETGVKIPVSKLIYEPVLAELKKNGISMQEHSGLPMSELPVINS